MRCVAILRIFAIPVFTLSLGLLSATSHTHAQDIVIPREIVPLQPQLPVKIDPARLPQIEKPVDAGAVTEQTIPPRSDPTAESEQQQQQESGTAPQQQKPPDTPSQAEPPPSTSASSASSPRRPPKEPRPQVPPAESSPSNPSQGSSQQSSSSSSASSPSSPSEQPPVGAVTTTPPPRPQRPKPVQSVSSSFSSSSQSEPEESILVLASSDDVTVPCEGSWIRPERFQRECFWYSDPIIDPDAILRPSDFAMGWFNPILAILVTLVVGFSGYIVNSFRAADADRMRMFLRRLPLQALVTLLLILIFRSLIPLASAQGTEAAGTSLAMLYLYIGAFFVVVNVSNFIFNNIVTSDGDRVHEFFVSHPFLERWVGKGWELSYEKWLIVLLLIAYGVVGAHISPGFSLFPQEQIGIVLVTTVAIILSAYSKDFMRFLLARVYKFPSWFKANVVGLCTAILCVALTRSLHLSPGYIYGVPVGLFIVAAAYERREGLFESLSLLWLMTLAVILWFLAPLLAAYPVFFDAANLFFIIGIEHAFIETLPVPYLAGGTIFRWRKIVWVLEFALIVFLLFQTLFNPKGTLVSLTQSPPGFATLILLGAYVIGVLWLWVAVVWGRKKT